METICELQFWSPIKEKVSIKHFKTKKDAELFVVGANKMLVCLDHSELDMVRYTEIIVLDETDDIFPK